MKYTKHATITGTAEVTVFTVPTGYHAEASYVFVANNGGSTNACTVYFDDGTNELHLLKSQNVSSGAKEEFYRGLFILHAGEELKAQTGSAGDVEVACTFELVEEPAVLVNFSDG